MNEEKRVKYLRIALLAVGLIFVFGVWPLTRIWPSGWAWHSEGRSYYLEMIIAIYATLGVFLLIASRNPSEHRSLIQFTIWSSIAHGGVMTMQSLGDQHQMGHLWGDDLALFAVAAVLWFFLPSAAKNRSADFSQG